MTRRVRATGVWAAALLVAGILVLSGSGCSARPVTLTADLAGSLEAAARATSTSTVACALEGAAATWTPVADSTLSTMFEAAVNQTSTVARMTPVSAAELSDRAQALGLLRLAARSIGECSATQADTSGRFLIDIAVWRVADADRRITDLAGRLRAEAGFGRVVGEPAEHDR